MKELIKSHKDLRVFQNALNSAMKVFQLTEEMSSKDKHSLIEPMRRSSRSVCSNIARAWRSRQFKTPFVSKLKDCEGEACETQVWVEFARQCHFLDDDACNDLDTAYDQIIGQLSKMMSQPEKWLIKKAPPPEKKNGDHKLSEQLKN